jgi:hypothetical protein
MSDSDLTIRPAHQRDTSAILAINAAGLPGVYPLTPEEVADTLAASPYFTVAELDGQVAGYLIGYTEKDRCEGDEFAWFQAHLSRFLYIDQIAVSPEARRARIGAQLYTHAADHARAQAIPVLVCEVNLDPPNPVSLQFHAQIGFKEVDVLSVGDGRTVSLLQWEVPAVPNA